MAMRSLVWMSMLVGAGLVGCDVPGSRPLPTGGASDEGGGAGPVTTTGGGPGGGTPTGDTPSADPCWEEQLPPEVQPMWPKLAVADACTMAATTTQWSYPGAATAGTPAATSDARALIVGRWVPCSGSTTWAGVPNTGVEFGANGRWRLLTVDETGTLTPMPAGNDKAAGQYYALASGQIDIAPDAAAGGQSIASITFAAPAGVNAMRLDGNDGTWSPFPGIYARTIPSPANGRDNPPSISDGRCLMFGTWDVPGNPVTPVEPPATLSFDLQGNFVGGPQGSNLCASHTMYGTYRLSPGLFQLTTNVGMGQCSWWFDAGYPATFDADCSHVTLKELYDNCTGGRGYLNGMTTLTRRSNGP